MSGPSEVTFFRCSLPTDAASAVVLGNLQEQGQLCGDHALRVGDRQQVLLTDAEVALLRNAGIDVEVLEQLSNEPPPPTPDGLGLDLLSTGFVSGYLDALGVSAAFAALQAAFPALTQWTDLPELTSGYDGAVALLGGPAHVQMLRITTTPAMFSKPSLLVVAGLHAREWAPPLAAIEFASQLLHNYAPGSTDPDVIAINQLVEGLDILIIGAANPDGINYSRHDAALWRKNRRPNPPFLACPGTDLNRNFSIYWGQGGSSPDPCDFQIYRGSAAFSEVENRNIRHVVELHPNILTAIDCHSYGENIFRPQPTGGSFIASEPVPTADHAIYLALEAVMNAAVGGVSPGKSYGTGTTSNHAGTFDEYMYFGHRIFGFELEIGLDFQPPIAEALVSVQEAAAVMRAIGQQTLSLSTRFITPVNIVQVIDKSGSMIGSGYVDSTRANARRLIDLMSLNDAAAVISFNDSALTELPLTAITSPGDYATARAAVDGIAFGGATSIGAGLQLGITALPAASSSPRSILLLSDGYENTLPMVSTVLPGVPAGVPVHTIALGLASDQPLLQSIATATGGTYFFSPDELGLFQIYNVAHATVADADMVLEDTVDLVGPVADPGALFFSRLLVIDDDADFATVTVAAQQSKVRLTATVRAISPPFTDVSRLRIREGDGYLVLNLKRPQPGVYELQVTAEAAAPLRCSVAAYVRSPLRLRLQAPKQMLAAGEPIDSPIVLLEHDRPWTARGSERPAVNAQVVSPTTSTRLLAAQWTPQMELLEKQTRGPDTLPEEVARAFAVRDYLYRQTGTDPFQYIAQPVHLVHPKMGGGDAALMLVRAPTAGNIDGTYTMRVAVTGRTSSGSPFARVAFQSVRVG